MWYTALTLSIRNQRHSIIIININLREFYIFIFFLFSSELGYRKCVQSKQELHLQNSNSEYANVSSQNTAPLDGLYSNSKVIAHRSLFQEVQNVHYSEITSINYVTSDFVDNVSYITILDWIQNVFMQLYNIVQLLNGYDYL